MVWKVVWKLKPFDGQSNHTMATKDEEYFDTKRLRKCILGVVHKLEDMTKEASNKAGLKVMTSIKLYLSDQVTYNVMEETNVKGTWDRL